MGTALLGMLLVVLAWTTLFNEKAVRQALGSMDSSAQIKRARSLMRSDLLKASRSHIAVATVPVTPTGFAEGTALWFLSCDDDQGLPQHDDAGNPRWHHNVLYYSILPTNHDALAGYHCTPGASTGILDDFCPHKVLIRKEIRYAAGSGTEQMIPASQLTPYLRAPVGHDFSSVPDSSGQKVAVVARSFLYFEAHPEGTGIAIDLRACDEMRARKQLAVGSLSLSGTPFTQSYTFSVLPDLP